MSNLLNLWSLIFGLLKKAGVADGQKTNTLASIALIGGAVLLWYGKPDIALPLIVMSGMGHGLRGALQNYLDQLPKE